MARCRLQGALRKRACGVAEPSHQSLHSWRACRLQKAHHTAPPPHGQEVSWAVPCGFPIWQAAAILPGGCPVLWLTLQSRSRALERSRDGGWCARIPHLPSAALVEPGWRRAVATQCKAVQHMRHCRAGWMLCMGRVFVLHLRTAVPPESAAQIRPPSITVYGRAGADHIKTGAAASGQHLPC